MATVDLEGLGALGTATLASDGSVIRSSGELEGDIKTLKTLYQMMLDTGSILGEEPLKRITVSFSDHQLVMAVSQGNVHIVKTRIGGI
mmetsp:Transcript_88517/g.176982  ORF Transcript_88517/g.176982 Transcript_88517/m.176982 type:complete len:88 (-) Transcript_88517:334-597(-)|eukprot:CAMPEP_0171628830 /NCGR_PEP_ID=MMETSP0990-20121206/21738_1 /TAXON_ID=483369 /ORGANISM="non described non described, Strain CCMP2098" /LENGTH=87 /DNA_ID=CAMNT_0012197225 /DNA_START=80 /DNA_END=343 /DNA_ORIENTATION=+